MRLFYWIALLLFAALLAVFAVSNREAVEIGFWPLSYVLELPLYLILLLALLCGFVAGELTAWVMGRRWRREVRRRGRRIEALERELAATQARLDVDGVPRTPLSARV